MEKTWGDARMSDAIEVTIPHDQVQLNGVIRFDGAVVEIFGFNDVHSVRMHIHQIESASVSFDKGLLAQPHIMFKGKWSNLGYNQAIDPPDQVKPELEQFVAKVNAAIERAA